MKLYSWNVNGIRAVVKKDFGEILKALDPDVLGLQETKAQDDQVREALFGLDGTFAARSRRVRSANGTCKQNPEHGVLLSEMEINGWYAC